MASEGIQFIRMLSDLRVFHNFNSPCASYSERGRDVPLSAAGGPLSPPPQRTLHYEVFSELWMGLHIYSYTWWGGTVGGKTGGWKLVLGERQHEIHNLNTGLPSRCLASPILTLCRAAVMCITWTWLRMRTNRCTDFSLAFLILFLCLLVSQPHSTLAFTYLFSML